MKRLLLLIIGIALLYFAFTSAANTGTRLAGGSTGSSGTIPLGTVKIEYSVNGK